MENEILMIGSPIEADQQLISLLNQGLVAYALSEDSDLPYQGALATIHKLQMNGKCNLITALNLRLEL